MATLDYIYILLGCVHNFQLSNYIYIILHGPPICNIDWINGSDQHGAWFRVDAILPQCPRRRNVCEIQFCIKHLHSKIMKTNIKDRPCLYKLSMDGHTMSPAPVCVPKPGYVTNEYLGTWCSVGKTYLINPMQPCRSMHKIPLNTLRM